MTLAAELALLLSGWLVAWRLHRRCRLAEIERDWVGAILAGRNAKKPRRVRLDRGGEAAGPHFPRLG